MFTTKFNFDFLSKRKIAYCASAIIILIGIVFMVAKGLKLGIDFTGGTVIQLKFKNNVEVKTIRSGLSSIGINEEVSIQKLVGTNSVILKLKEDKNISNKLLNEFSQKISMPFEIESVEVVGPSVGSWLIKRAMLAFFISFIGIIIYVGIRFKGGIWGVSGVIAIIHDVLIVISVFSILNKEISLLVVAAIMTIVGYSMNDTVVIYDRIRETFAFKTKDKDLYSIINSAINQTLSRTIITSGVTLLTVFALYVFGGKIIKDFSLALLIGMISGVYSTIFVATAIVYDFEKNKR